MASPVTISVTTIADGSGNNIANVGDAKLLYAVEWNDGDLIDGVDAVLSKVNTINGTDRTIVTLTNANSDAFYYPRLAETDNAGAALTTTTLPMISGTVKLTITSGGDTKTGGVTLHMIDL